MNESCQAHRVLLRLDGALIRTDRVAARTITAARPCPAPAVQGGRAGAAHVGGQGPHRHRHRHQGPEDPVKNPCPDSDTRRRNQLIASMRVPAERANALIKRIKTLGRITLDSTKQAVSDSQTREISCARDSGEGSFFS